MRPHGGSLVRHQHGSGSEPGAGAAANHENASGARAALELLAALRPRG